MPTAKKKYSFKDGPNTYYGNTVEDIANQMHAERKGTSHPVQSYNVIYNAVIRGMVEAISPASKQPVVESPEKTIHLGPQKITAQGAVSAAKALMKIISGKHASQDEIHRRASICRECPHLSDTSDCNKGCTGVLRRVAQLGGRIREMFARVEVPNLNGSPPIKKFCGKCGCSMSLLLPVRAQDYKKESASEQAARPMLCWLRKDSKNYKPPEE